MPRMTLTQGPFRAVLVLGTALCLLIGCDTGRGGEKRGATPQAAADTPARPAATAPATAETPEETVLPTAPVSPATPTPLPTASALPSATATPDPLYPFTIAGMRARDFAGGKIELGELVGDNGQLSRYRITYPSDGLRISGLMNVPVGEGPFPVVILLHGYYDRDQYQPGAGTWQAADFLAGNGYLTIAPDLRSWGGSESGPSLFHMGLVADVLYLIGALPSLPQADPSRLGLWGHSMGGGIATKVLAIDDRPRAAVLYAPNSADDADLIERWGPGCLPGQSEAAGDTCNPAEVITPDLAPGLVEAYLRTAADREALRAVAPLYHLEQVQAPVQIHIGTADGAALAQTPPEWSAKLFAALQAADKEAAYFTYPGEGHFLQTTAWYEMMNRALALFDERLQE
jgi:dienelactone hydrolase